MNQRSGLIGAGRSQVNTACVEVRRSQVEEQLSRQLQTISSLSETAQALIARLTPVLREADKVGPNSVPQEYLVPVAASVRSNTDGINNVMLMLSDVLERLEV
jgi:hypothetical protein